MKQKIFKIEKSHILESENMIFSHMGAYSLFTSFNLKYSDNIGCTDCIQYGENNIYQENDILIVFGSPLSIYRIYYENNKICFTRLYAKYTIIVSHTVSFKHKKIFYSGYYDEKSSTNTDCIVELDFSDLNNIIETKEKFKNYFKKIKNNSIQACGDYLYLFDDNFHVDHIFCRYNISSKVSEFIELSQSIIDTLYRYPYNDKIMGFIFDKENNRLFIYSLWGPLLMFKNPQLDYFSNESFEIISLFSIRGNPLGISISKFNKNHIFAFENYYGFSKFDITPTLTNNEKAEILIDGDSKFLTDPYYIAYYKLKNNQTELNNITVFNPRYNISPLVWFDEENRHIVGICGRIFAYDYSDFFYPMNNDNIMYSYRFGYNEITFNNKRIMLYLNTSDEKTYKAAHYNDRMLAFNYEDVFMLNKTANIKFGDFRFDTGDNIYAFNINNVSDLFTIPTDCRVEIYVTNNKLDWERYDIDKKEVHVFSSSGNCCQFKIYFYGKLNKSPYIINKNFSLVIYNKKNKIISSNRIKGSYNDI